MPPQIPESLYRRSQVSVPIEKEKLIVVIGTGDLGRALATCLLRVGYRVVVASRNPEKRRAQIQEIGGEIATLEEASILSRLLVLAIPFEGLVSLPKELLQGKILIDPTNRPINFDANGESLAARLQKALPQSKVVKAFNTLSAYSLLNGLYQSSREVPICSDNLEAKIGVQAVIRDMGLHPVDFGCLARAKTIEDIPFTFFPEWKYPFAFSIVVWIFSVIYILLRSNICPNIKRLNDGLEWDWSSFVHIPFPALCSSFGHTSLTLLATCYLPGVIASYLQLYRKTKYSPFPNWLDKWLKGRKYLGLLSLLFIFPHIIIAFANIINYGGLWGIWREPVYFATGTIAAMLMSVLGVTSLPSVAMSLTWKEFSFLQRYLGWLSLVLSTLHIVFIGWSSLIENNIKCFCIPGTSQVS